MGIAILTLLLCVEIFFLVWRIAGKSCRLQEKAIANLAELAIFTVLALFNVIEWSFRYYFLAATLLTLAIIAVITLVKKSDRPYKLSRAIGGFVQKLFLFTFACAAAIVFPQYAPLAVSPEFDVAETSYAWVDESRTEQFSGNGEHRAVSVDVYSPKDGDGKYPLVVFSHGSFGYSNTNYSLYRRLASSGYIVASINHPYHAFFDTKAYGKLVLVDNGFLNDVVGIQTTEDFDREFVLSHEWLKLRVDDGSFVIDTITAIADEGTDPVLSHVDTGRIGVMGHSLGGAMAAQLGRERDDISAVIDLDGSLIGDELAYANGVSTLCTEPYPVPMLDIFTEDHYNRAQDVKDVYQNFLITGFSPNVTNVMIEGTAHMNFTDLPMFSPILAKTLDELGATETPATCDSRACIERLNEMCLEFFDAYLKDGEAPVFSEEF